MTGFLHEYEATMAMIKSINAPLKLVIAGNHDISLDGEYYARKGRQMHSLKEHDSTVVPRAREMWTGEEAKKAGVRYLDEGCYTFVLRNGARLRVSAVRVLAVFFVIKNGADSTLHRSMLHSTSQRSATGPSPTLEIRTDTIPQTSARRMPNRLP